MTEKELNTEERIFHSACEVFLLYGYHGTKIRKITELSGANNFQYWNKVNEKIYKKTILSFYEMFYIFVAGFGYRICKITGLKN